MFTKVIAWGCKQKVENIFLVSCGELFDYFCGAICQRQKLGTRLIKMKLITIIIIKRLLEERQASYNHTNLYQLCVVLEDWRLNVSWMCYCWNLDFRWLKGQVSAREQKKCFITLLVVFFVLFFYFEIEKYVRQMKRVTLKLFFKCKLHTEPKRFSLWPGGCVVWPLGGGNDSRNTSVVFLR